MRSLAGFAILFAASLMPSRMEAQDLVTFNHLAIYVKNLKKSQDFYQNVLQLKSVSEPFHDGKHAWLRMATNITLHIVEGADSTVRLRSDHFCFSTASISTFIERLKQFNILYVSASDEPFKITKRVDGVQQIYFQDPDGYWIELNDAKQ